MDLFFDTRTHLYVVVTLTDTIHYHDLHINLHTSGRSTTLDTPSWCVLLCTYRPSYLPHPTFLPDVTHLRTLHSVGGPLLLIHPLSVSSTVLTLPHFYLSHLRTLHSVGGLAWTPNLIINKANIKGFVSDNNSSNNSNSSSSINTPHQLTVILSAGKSTHNHTSSVNTISSSSNTPTTNINPSSISSSSSRSSNHSPSSTHTTHLVFSEGDTLSMGTLGRYIGLGVGAGAGVGVGVKEMPKSELGKRTVNEGGLGGGSGMVTQEEGQGLGQGPRTVISVTGDGSFDVYTTTAGGATHLLNNTPFINNTPLYQYITPPPYQYITPLKRRTTSNYQYILSHKSYVQ